MMKNLALLLAAGALAATGACTKKSGEAPAANVTSSAPTVAVTAPASGDWTEAVAPTAAGGFVMGNPDAKVKLVEYGSQIGRAHV